MKADYHGQFVKQWQKLPAKQQKQLFERLALFQKAPFDRQLRNHQLKGKYEGFRSIDITGDLRAIYRPVSADEAFFVAVGTHSQLYR